MNQKQICIFSSQSWTETGLVLIPLAFSLLEWANNLLAMSLRFAARAIFEFHKRSERMLALFQIFC